MLLRICLVETYLELKMKSSGNFSLELDERDMAKLKAIVRQFGEVDGNKAVMASLSKGMEVIVRKGKSNLQNKKTGNLKKSLRRKQVKKWSSVYGGFRRGKGGGNHAHLIDRGTDKRYTKKNKYRGSVFKKGTYTGNRFWTKAVMSEAPKAMEKTMSVIGNELGKIIAKNK